MSNQTELDPRNQEAVDAALAGSWELAVKLNSELAEEYSEDVNVLNRLAHAYAELGQVNKSSNTYKKVLEIDPYNPIAKRNLERLSTLRISNIKIKESTRTIDPDLFIEEPGKTKTITVVDLAMPKMLVSLRTGDNVDLNSNKTDVAIISEDNHRLGKLESGWGKEIAEALRLGSQFSAVVKSVKVGKNPNNSALTVFLRETKRSHKLAHPTFPIENNNFTPFVREETLNYLKDQEISSSAVEAEGIENVGIEEIPESGAGNNEPPPIEVEEPLPDLIEDEEDFSPK